MFVSDRLIFLELPKTGCSHIIKLLKRVVSGREKGKHNRPPKRLIRSSLPIVGSIRNPWDWYVSLWAFGCAGGGNVYERLVEAGFEGLYGDVERPELFRRWLYFIHEARGYRVIGKGYGVGPISQFAGFLSFRYAHLFSSEVKPLRDGGIESIDDLVTFVEANDMKDYVIRREHLESDLLETLIRIGIHPCSEDREWIWNHSPTNTSNRKRDPGFYYDRESAQLVSEREQLILRRYTYEPPNT